MKVISFLRVSEDRRLVVPQA